MSVHKLKADTVDLLDALDTKLRDIGTVADLIAVADSDSIGIDGLNGAGYLIGRLLEDVQDLKAQIRKQSGGVVEKGISALQPQEEPAE